MAKTKLEKIADIELQQKQLENQKKQLLQQHKEQERKDRTKRLCKRMGLFESILPDTITLTDEQFKTFLEKTVQSDYARKILTGLAGQSDETVSGIASITEDGAASQMEKRGIRTERGDINREIMVTNNQLRQLKARISKLQGWLQEEMQNTEPPSLADYIQDILSRKHRRENRVFRNPYTTSKTHQIC